MQEIKTNISEKNPICNQKYKKDILTDIWRKFDIHIDVNITVGKLTSV